MGSTPTDPRPELALVLLVGVLPLALLHACTIPPCLEEPPSPFPFVALAPQTQARATLLAYATFVLAPALAIYRSGLPPEHFGLVLRPGDLRWGLVGLAINYVAGWAVWFAYLATGFPLGVESIRAFHYVHAPDLAAMVATWPWYVMVVAGEELMARSYLLTRLRDLSGSDRVAIVGSSLLYAGWHMFWGWAGAVHVFVGGLVFGWLFVARRGVGAPAVSHFAFDALTLLPR